MLFDFSKSVEDYKKEFDVKDDDVFGRANSYIHDWNPEQVKMFVSTGKYPVIKTDEENKDEAVAEAPQRRTAPRTFNLIFRENSLMGSLFAF